MVEVWLGSESCGTRKWAFSASFLMLLLHCLAIFLFTRGFLLTRTELPHHSQCSDVSQSPCVSRQQHHSSINQTSNQCWTRPVVDRLVIIVLDALRFDFVAPSTFFPEKKPWMDKLQVLHKLASQPGLSAKIFKAIADPPTTSLQRLKGLTTGGLPTFIDVGNSFGAPAIVEDNLIYQLVQNGKRVMMMGDDTWLQLFPNHFYESYPFPSFNVKDLDTVDNGCIEHLFPALYKEDWDVLIAHFLGVDHAGHIFGVDSVPMIEKLEQYNEVLEKVIEVLESQHGPGGLHENTLLLVMGDHGQTLNGDHGGGNPEEVETSIFALSFKKPLPSLPPELSTSSCGVDLVGRNICVSSVQQLDFAVTVSALLGIPFPFGSIGQVNPELFALAAGTCNLESSNESTCKSPSDLEEWMQSYFNVLCINSWQVKKYIDIYSASSMIGFSKEDLLHVSSIYSQAQEIRSQTLKDLVLPVNESCSKPLPAFNMQIDAYFKFLASISELARSKWTEFNLKMMGTGICIMLGSLLIHYIIIKRVDKLYGISYPSCGTSMISSRLTFAYVAVLMRSFSFLSNSYILGEGKVANFLLATTGMLSLRYSMLREKMLLEAVFFLLLIPILRFSIELGQLKQAVNSAFLKINPSWMLGFAKDSPIWMYAGEIVPMVALAILAHVLYKSINRKSGLGTSNCVIAGAIVSYILILVYWATESSLLIMPEVFGGINGRVIPQIVYAIGFVQLFLLLFLEPFLEKRKFGCKENIIPKTVAMLSAWSSTIILLSGKQGPLVALAAIVGGWCIIKLKSLGLVANSGASEMSTFYSSPVTQWSILAVCLFFCTGHWCAFDGLRYAAAFIGFDEFNLIRGAILLTIETFGFSLILPILGLPLLVAYGCAIGQPEQRKHFFRMQLSQVYMIYGLIVATTVTFTILCVTIHRRHLMVWGLFAPKFVFDVVGLVLTDAVICLASFYYFG